jgi:hypothetical protein
MFGKRRRMRLIELIMENEEPKNPLCVKAGAKARGGAFDCGRQGCV